MGANSSRGAMDDAAIVKALDGIGQSHLTSAWTAETAAADKQRFFGQVKMLETAYPGGLRGYVENSRRLLADSKAGVNPLEGWSPSVPEGAWLSFASDEFLDHEKLGMKEIGGTSFVLVAGGLGERLGFSGIKVALPWQTTSGQTYIELYIRSILAMQQAASVATGKPVVLPLAIMVSDDTAARTDALLKEHDNFGMAPGQVRHQPGPTRAHRRSPRRRPARAPDGIWPPPHPMTAGDTPEARKSAVPFGQ